MFFVVGLTTCGLGLEFAWRQAMVNRDMFKVLERNESEDSVQYVLDRAYQQFADNAGVSVGLFRRALGIVVFEGYYGYDGQGDSEDYINIADARKILHRAANGEPPSDYPFFATEWHWCGEDEDGNPLPNAVILGDYQTKHVFQDYIEIYGRLP